MSFGKRLFLMLLSLYRSLTNLGAPLVGVWLRVRRAKGREDRARFSERFGYPSQPRPEGRLVWCHAASVGEAASLLLLIERIHEIYPTVSFVLTTGTVTAAQMAEKRLPSCAVHQYVPVDLVPCVARFLDHWKPMLAVWIESELWPNSLAALRERSIPAILLNARMSDKSFRNWYRVKGFARELLSAFHLCLAQTQGDQGRFVALGARPVKCVGNLKYVSSPLPFDEQELARLREAVKSRPLWLMASTHPGEEEMALAAHRALKGEQPRLLTVIAPRHAVRGGEVAQLIESSGLSCARRSRGEKITEETEVYLADTMGDMGLLYALCPVTVLGGSFAGTGGHNPIEPAQLGSAILFGPSMYNFSEIEREFISDRAAIKLQGPHEIASAVSRLISDKIARDYQTQSARLLAEWKRSILTKIILEMDPWLRERQ
jgi:3-deoxy-D-manno-octulosonic-acid transferase